MQVSIGERWMEFIETVVSLGRYGSPSDVVQEGLRLVAMREAKFLKLRDSLEKAVALGGALSDDAVAHDLDARAMRFRRDR